MSKKKKNHKKANHPRIRIGEKRSFPIITDNEEMYFINSINTGVCDIEMGVSFEVMSSGVGDRHIFADYPSLYQEIKVGDKIIEYDRFEENTLYASMYIICDICNNAAVAIAVKGDFFYRDKDD